MDINKVNIPITSWAEKDRPREKLISIGKSALSDSELIALLIRAGTKKSSAVDLAKLILSSVNDNLIELSKLNINELTKFHGIGEAKAISIVAALELGKRRREEDVLIRKQIKCSQDIFEIIQSNLADLHYEEFWIMLLNRSNHLLKKVVVSEGGISATIVDPKKIMKIAIENNATYIILCHNHPSGSVVPSESDIKLTKKLIEAGNLLELPIIDHIIIGDEKYYSFRDEGKM